MNYIMRVNDDRIVC